LRFTPSVMTRCSSLVMRKPFIYDADRCVLISGINGGVVTPDAHCQIVFFSKFGGRIGSLISERSGFRSGASLYASGTEFEI